LPGANLKPLIGTLAILLLAAFALTTLPVAQSPAWAKAKKRSHTTYSSGGGSSGITLKTPPPSNPLEHNNRGVELGKRGLWLDAIREHEMALNADPYNQTYRQNLSSAEMRYGIDLYKRGSNYQAISHFREALYADPNNAEADHWLDSLIEKAKGKNDLATRLHEADEAEISGNFPVAIVEYRKCVRMDDSGPMRAKLGRVLLKQGKIRDGFEELKSSLVKNWPEADKNDLAECHRELAEIEKDQAQVARDSNRMAVALRRLDNAGIEYRKAVTLNPNNMDAVHGLIEVARNAVAINGTFNNHLMLAGAYQLAGDYERAKMEYETCYKLNRNSDVLAQARRSFHLWVVSYPRSPVVMASTMQKVEDSLRQSPDDAELLYIYGRGKEVQGEPDVALKAYQAAATINAFIFPDLKDRIQSLSGGGSSHPGETPSGSGSGKPSEGKPEAKASAKEGQKTPAQTSAGSGSGSAAANKAPVDQGTEQAKNPADYSSVESKLRTNDIDGAQALALALVDKDQHDAHAWFLLGRTHEKKNDLDQASVAYRQAAYLKDPEAKEALAQVDISRVQPMFKEADEKIKKSDWVGASSSLKDAEAIAPNLPIVHRRLAEALKQLGDTKEAQRESKRADDLEKDAK
jgi:tetratricopeptide (TPR) repeat protein